MVAITEPTIFTVGRSRVSTSADLVTGDDWTPRPYLHCDRLTLTASPGMDEALLSYDIGRFMARETPIPDEIDGDPVPQSGAFVPLDINRHYCKVEVFDAAGNTRQTWYGVIEVSESPWQADGAGYFTGTQTFRAFGLLRLFEQTVIRDSRIEGSDGLPMTIRRGLSFNDSPLGAYGLRGNRMEATGGEYPSTYLFSYDPFGVSLWTAENAVRHLLNYHPPTDSAGDAVATMELFGEIDALDWYEITAHTERRTLREVLDEVIDRRRMVSYHVYGYEDDAEFRIRVHVFTHASADVTLPTGGVLAANPDQVELNFAQSPLMTQSVLSRTIVHAVDRVVGEGEYVTSTATFRGDTDLSTGWETADETAYLAAAGGTETENTAARSRDEWQDVFSRFFIDFDWPMKTTRISDDVEFVVVPVYANIEAYVSTDDDVVDSFDDTVDQGEWWFTGKTFLRRLTSRSENTDEYPPPFVFFKEQDSDPAVYRLAEKLDTGASEDANSQERNFACSLSILDNALGIRVTVNRPGAQQLIAKTHWSGAATTKAADDPSTSDNNAVKYEDMWLTASVEWDDRVSYSKDVTTVIGAKHVRERTIFIPDCRLDFEVPGTVTGIDEDGALVESDGRIIRDDRPRMRDIVDAAAQWYGVERKTVKVEYASSTPAVTVGQLIATLDGETVNTLVTAVVYDLVGMAVTIETSFAEVDFA